MTLITKNLVLNGNAETGAAAGDFSTTDAPTHWLTTGSFTAITYAADDGLDDGGLDESYANAHGDGSAYFAGGSGSDVSTATQSIDVSAFHKAIDKGNMSFLAGADLGGYVDQDDSMNVTFTFYAADHTTVLSTITIDGPDAADREDVSGILHTGAADEVPKECRFVDVTLTATRTDGVYNDGYADNVSFQLYGPGVSSGYLLLDSTHDYRSDSVPAASGLQFDTDGAADDSFNASQFGHGKISLDATIVGDQQDDTIDIYLDTQHFDASGFTFQNWDSAKSLIFEDTSGDDTVIGSSRDDTFFLAQGGNDTVHAGAGTDSFGMGAGLNAADRIDGGDGVDAITLQGDYSAGLTLKATTVTNVEYIYLEDGFSYKLTLSNGTVAAGATMFVSAFTSASDHVIVDGSKELDGSLSFTGGASDDTFIGGQAGNNFSGGGGADHMTAGSGYDLFYYLTGASDSTSTHFDVIDQFDADVDDFFTLGVAHIDPTIAGGKLSQATFDHDLAAAVDKHHLAVGDAVLFEPNKGTYKHDTFLIVEMNGKAGYQAGQDLVVELTHAQHMADFSTGNFIFI